jgi:hypothetical protein
MSEITQNKALAAATRRSCASFRARISGTRVARLVWVLLLLIHVVPIEKSIAAIAGGHAADGAMMRMLLLCASAVFFGLKIADVRWLRWRVRHSGVVAFVLAAALVHDEFLPQSAQQAILFELPATLSVSILLCELTESADTRLRLRDGLRVDFSTSFFLLQTCIASIAFGSGKEKRKCGLMRSGRAPPIVIPVC